MRHPETAPTTHTAERCMQGLEKLHRNNLIIKLNERIKNIVSFIEDWCKEKIVFARPLLPFGTVGGSPRTLHTFANHTG